ncbi:unnamed protein product [Meloidogyne enterolobii]|uniref:Uncharacterized protein n=1 Tax=Meloidogyne enterolobii TaxID=390850 RepID=A0ACB0ZQ79_MELEN
MTKLFILLLFSNQIIILINCQPPFLHDKLIIEYGGDKCEFKEIDKGNNEKKLRKIPILFHNKQFIARLVFLFGRNDNLYFTLWESL